jgi:adenylate cyclase
MPTTVNRTLRLDPAKCVEARTRKGLSRERLADSSHGGLSIATIKRIEQGAAIYLDTARRFALLLDAALDHLVVESDPSRAAPEAAVRNAPATIVVLPFDVTEGDEKERVFAAGLVEDMITRFTREWFPVIARSSSFAYPPGTLGARLRADLGVDYVVEGSVRRGGDTIRVTARLADARSARLVWANSYDKSIEDVFTMQDAIVATIIGHIRGAMLDTEYRRIRHRNPSDLTGWEVAIQGSWHFHHRTKDGNLEARSLFEDALRRDPAIPLAWYYLALTHQRAIINQWTTDPGATLRAMHGICKAFAGHHPEDPGLRIATAYALVFSGERLAAKSHLREAIDLDANAVTAYSLYGQTLAMENEPDEAIEQFEQAMRLSPRDAELWSIQTAIALCHFVAERYQEMHDWAERALVLRPDMPFAHGAKAVAGAYMGDLDGARASVETMRRLEPRTNLLGVKAIVASTNADIAERYIEGLRKAGLPG